MFNDHDTAVYNQQTQQNGADAIVNYNQQHGVIGDLLESAQDALAVNSGISEIGTGGSRQTGELIVQMSGTEIRNGDLTVGAHSQGTLMTQVGMTQQQEDLETLVQGNLNAEFLVQYSGSPVNHYIAEELMTDIYGGEQGIKEHIKDGGIDDVFRSQVAPEDFVGSVLGYQSAGINNSENLGENMRESTLSIGRLFGVGGDSTHTYYGCILGCGDENFTPDKGNYHTPNQLDVDGKPQTPVENYYIDRFSERDENGNIKKDASGNPIMTIEMDLLPSNDRLNNQISTSTSSSPINLKNVQGAQ